MKRLFVMVFAFLTILATLSLTACKKETHTHTYGEWRELTPATCTTDGSYDNVKYCTVCKGVASRQTITITAKGHTPGEIVVENEVAMNCTDNGSYDNVRYCEICQSEASRETVIIPAPGAHDYDGYNKEVIKIGRASCRERV